MNERETILMAGVEDGGIALYGTRGADGWEFHQRYLDRSGLRLGEPEILRERVALTGWEAALAALDGEGWWRWPATRVHPEFRERVWVAMRDRLAPDGIPATPHADRLLARWRARCLLGCSRTR